MIIRSYVYATSVVHATVRNLRSLIGARTCMRVYTNSAELDAQSEQGISKSSAEKIYMRIALQKSSARADRLLDNHVVISEHRKFCSLVRKWVSERDRHNRGWQKHILLISCLMIETYTVGLN